MTALELTLCCIGILAVVALAVQAMYVIHKEVRKRRLAAARRQRRAERSRRQDFVDLMEELK